jgi:ATP-dependent RNA helicase SUPV3L1/SUV3
VRLWLHLARLRSGAPTAPPEGLPPTVGGRDAPVGYRQVGQQALRVDLADKLLQEAHRRRLGAHGRRVFLDPSRARSMGLSTASYAALLRLAGFRVAMPRPLPEGAMGPLAPPLWDWRPPRRMPETLPVPDPGQATGAFAALAGLLR